MGRYYKRDGIPVEAWSEIPSEDLGFHVGDTNVNNVSTVTTVFTGFNLGSDNDPKIYETLIHGGYYDGSRELYFTEEEATLGHARWVELVNKPLPDDVEFLGDLIAESNEVNSYKIAEYLISTNKINIKR